MKGGRELIDFEGNIHKLPIEGNGKDKNEVYKILYHVFGNNWDEWFTAEKEARLYISDRIKSGERDLRIYADLYFDKEEYDYGDCYEFGIYFLGEFPE